MSDQPPVTGKPPIAELEALLQRDDLELEILPNGEVRATPRPAPAGDVKPIIFRQDLGGEYARA